MSNINISCMNCAVKACQTGDKDKYPPFCLTKNMNEKLHNEVLEKYNDEENNDKIEDRFNQDAKRYWQSVKEPKITIKVNYADLSKTELYKDYLEAKHCNVGDTGTVQCEELGVNAKLKVIKKVTDILKDEVDSIEFGNLAATLTTPKIMSQTINTTKF